MNDRGHGVEKNFTNRLASEKSPYLLRHAANPVDWYPWGKEAFDRAQEQDKPLFLSIGYSSCHWCHVMERECFNDPEVAEFLNDACVSVKVDREERPDLDALFMEVCCIQNGSGGWPLNLFLTPAGEPFFAATWLPKRTQGRIPGLADIVPRVKWLWLMQREDVLKGARDLVKTFVARSTFAPGLRLGVSQGKNALKELKNTYDATWGGFGFAPKFPCVPRLLFLLEYTRGAYARGAGGGDEVFAMVDHTLRRMWRGGIHDHLGGGFARYAVDERWTVPHFEKMLCDQALLLRVAALAHQIRPDDFTRHLAEDIVRCVTRDFQSPEAVFWTAIDAESEGDEGRYYLWTEEEIRATLPLGDSALFCATYAILPGGNFMHEVTGRQSGHNVLYEAATVGEVARRYGMRAPELAERLANARRVLWEARNRRPPPAVDDKVLMEGNGLMIGSLAFAGRVFEKKEWVLAAERAALFLQKVLVDPKGNWRRRYRLKEAAIPALPGDYAALMWGVLELYEATTMEKQKKDWLRYAVGLAAKLEENYWDDERGGLHLSQKDDPWIFWRRKAARDDATPSANALAMMAYTALARAQDENRKYQGMARAIGACFARAAHLAPIDHISLLTASMQLQGLRGRKMEDEKPDPAEKKLRRDETKKNEEK